MNAKDFVVGKEYNTSKGFPVGRTLIDFENADFMEVPFTEDDGTQKKINTVKIGTETYYVPISVMRKVKEGIELKAAAVEVNRSGTTKTDTKYVSYILDTNGKIIK